MHIADNPDADDAGHIRVERLLSGRLRRSPELG
jgi:hypothetical protein